MYMGFQRALHASAVPHTELPARLFSRARDAIRPHSAAAQISAYRYKVCLMISVQMCASLMRRWDHRAETALFNATDEKHDARKWNALLRFNRINAYAHSDFVITVNPSGQHNLWCLAIAATSKKNPTQPSPSGHKKA
jgi:hypothetical protein